MNTQKFCQRETYWKYTLVIFNEIIFTWNPLEDFFTCMRQRITYIDHVKNGSIAYKFCKLNI